MKKRIDPLNPQRTYAHDTAQPQKRTRTAGSGASVRPASGRGQKHRLGRPTNKPRLHVIDVLRWADAHHVRTGTWPLAGSGKVVDSPWENWNAIDQCLRKGGRGLPAGASLARLLYRRRGVRNVNRPPPLTENQILIWADAYHARHGAWPHQLSGPVDDAPGESWAHVQIALRVGMRSLPGGSSLARFLTARRGARYRRCAPDLTVTQVLRWARQHRRRTGRWPMVKSGAVQGGPNGETWLSIDQALRRGKRGLPGDLSIARLLHQRLGVRNPRRPPPLSVRRILHWAQAHFRRTGRWPTAHTGRIKERPEETWCAVASALDRGRRGLPGGRPLGALLARELGAETRGHRPPLNIETILSWARAHRRRTGKWPIQKGGPITERPQETWDRIDKALRHGTRGLPRGSSLAALLGRPRPGSRRAVTTRASGASAGVRARRHSGR